MDSTQTSSTGSPERATPRPGNRKRGSTKQAAVFSVLVLAMGVGAALAIRTFELPAGPVSSTLYMITPTAATLVMLLGVTRDGYTKEGWQALGLHKAGRKAWGVAIAAPLLVAVTATAVVWATPLASFTVPADGASRYILGFFVQLVLFTVTLSLFEELGWRGYLLDRLSSLSRTRASIWVGLVWAAWHLPLMLLTPIYHSGGNRWIGIPLFVAAVVATSFLFGYLRYWTDSVWPAAIAHTVHNAAWGTLAAFSTTSSPVTVNEYLVGDNGVLILLGTVVASLLLAHRVGSRFPTTPPPPAPESEPSRNGVDSRPERLPSR